MEQREHPWSGPETGGVREEEKFQGHSFHPASLRAVGQLTHGARCRLLDLLELQAKRVVKEVQKPLPTHEVGGVHHALKRNTNTR